MLVPPYAPVSLEQIATWPGWHRHITLCLQAHAFLAVTRAAAAGAQGGMPAT